MKPYDAARVIEDIAKRQHGLKMTKSDIESFLVHHLSEKHRITLDVDKEGEMKFTIRREGVYFSSCSAVSVTLTLDEARVFNKFSSEIIDSYDQAKQGKE